jgi:membrane-bound serine protease (ClpP class)
MGFAAWWTAVAIVAGLACIAIELFLTTGTMVAGLIGFILLFGGLVGTFMPVPGRVPGGSTGHDLSLGLATVVLSMGTALVAMFFLTKYFGSIPFLRRAILPNPDEVEENFADSDRITTVRLGEEGAVRVGAEAVVVSPLRPTGMIEVGQQIVEATASLGFISSGAQVRVVDVSGTKVMVELIREGPAAAPIADVPLPSPEDVN